MGYKTKAEWAAAQARNLRQQAAGLHDQRLPSADWRGIRGKMVASGRLHAEAARYARMAERFRQQGL